MTQTQTPAAPAVSLEDALALVAQMRDEIQALKAAAPAPKAAFVPTVTLTPRPIGWRREGAEARFASTREKLAVSIKRFANGGTKHVGSQGGFDRLTWAAILANADAIRAWVEAGEVVVGEDEGE